MSEPKKKPGRPEKRVLKLDMTPQQAAQAIFAAAKPPDPSLRIKK